jgi:hypothetical protein
MGKKGRWAQQPMTVCFTSMRSRVDESLRSEGYLWRAPATSYAARYAARALLTVATRIDFARPKNFRILI